MDKNISAIGLGFILVIISNVIGHVAPPFSIFVTPVLMTIIIAGINFGLYKSNFTLTVIYNFGLLLFNDLFIRLYAGGTHDQEGKGWIFLFFAIAFILAVVTMIIYSFGPLKNQSKISRPKHILANILTVVIFSTLTALLYYFKIGDI
ncbi:MAG: hypothetical protein V4613_13835 [Bacteroidota bacterium]